MKYVVIERQYNEDVAYEFPDADTAEEALQENAWIDGLCQEDCLDAYVADEVPDGVLLEPLGEFIYLRDSM